jgi:hypothetical protein
VAHIYDSLCPVRHRRREKTLLGFNYVSFAYPRFWASQRPPPGESFRLRWRGSWQRSRALAPPTHRVIDIEMEAGVYGGEKEYFDEVARYCRW